MDNIVFPAIFPIRLPFLNAVIYSLGFFENLSTFIIPFSNFAHLLMFLTFKNAPKIGIAPSILHATPT
jgi:hypothetical protein